MIRMKFPYSQNTNRARMLFSWVVCCVIFLSFIKQQGAIAMSILDAGKVVLFSEMKGQLLMKGEPIKQAKIRRVAHFGKDFIDFSITDDEGRFEFPELSTRTINKFLPMEFTARQELFVEIDGAEIVFWEGVKAGPEPNAESRGKLLDAICELDKEQTVVIVETAPYFTKCKWDVEEDENNTGF